jgi:hypothetical protein
MLSVIIPSRTEVFLNNTIRDVLKNATGEIEVIPILDGYEPDELVEDDRVHYIRLPKNKLLQKRHGVNQGVKESKGEYVMSLDAHCMVAKGFDEQLIKDHQPNWVQIPRRNRLDAKNWCIQEQYGKPPIDYEYFMWNSLLKDKGLHGYKWNERTIARKDIMIDDTMTMQASCWFMTKKWYNDRKFMKTEGYRGWGAEAEEICLETLKNGGEVKVNKNTSYAHLHKGATYGRMYWMNKWENDLCYKYSYNYWVHENKDFFIKLINRFMPLPNWPEKWVDMIYKEK